MLTQTEGAYEIDTGKLSGRFLDMQTKTESVYEIDTGKLSGSILRW